MIQFVVLAFVFFCGFFIGSHRRPARTPTPMEESIPDESESRDAREQELLKQLAQSQKPCPTTSVPAIPSMPSTQGAMTSPPQEAKRPSVLSKQNDFAGDVPDPNAPPEEDSPRKPIDELSRLRGLSRPPPDSQDEDPH